MPACLPRISTERKEVTIQQMRDLLTRVPSNTLLGMRLHRVHRDGISIAILRHFGGRRRAATVELKINLLPAGHGGPHPDAVPPATDRFHLMCGSVDLRGEHGRAIGAAVVTYMLIYAPVAFAKARSAPPHSRRT